MSTNAASLSALSPSARAPYPPSWIDRLIAFLDRLPAPPYLVLTLVAVVLYCISTLLHWSDGYYPVGTFSLYHALGAATIPYSIGLIRYLDRRAVTALAAFSPALTISPADEADVRYRLTTLPARPTLLASVIGALVGILTVVLTPLSQRTVLYHLSASTLSRDYHTAVYILMAAVAGVLVYHTFHQLRMVDYIYTRFTHVNLYEPSPLYGLSGLSARSAVGWTIALYAWFAIEPATFSDLPATLNLVPGLLLIPVAFLLPLLGIHRLMEQEKYRLAVETNRRLKDATEELHRRVDAHEFSGMDDINKAIASLEIELRVLKQIPTWPWNPDSFRWFIAALLFPVVVWLIQQILSRVLDM